MLFQSYLSHLSTTEAISKMWCCDCDKPLKKAERIKISSIFVVVSGMMCQNDLGDFDCTAKLLAELKHAKSDITGADLLFCLMCSRHF